MEPDEIEPQKSAAQVVQEVMTNLYNVQVTNIEDPRRPGKQNIPVITIPEGQKMVSDPVSYIEQFLPRPIRKTGEARFGELDSYMDHTNRFKNDHSVVFVNPDLDDPTITTVFDYHEKDGGEPDFMEHRGIYHPIMSIEWLRWKNRSGHLLSQEEFSHFLEDNIADIIDYTIEEKEKVDQYTHLSLAVGGTYANSSRLLELSRSLSITQNEKVGKAINLNSGESQINYSCEHLDEAGQPVVVPNLFMIAIPVFEGGVHYRIPVRLRYRISDGKVKWCFELYRHELVVKAAIGEAVELVKGATGLPVYYGDPEILT